MTNTVTIPSNVLPEDGRFGSGPTKIRPEQIQALDKGARNLLGTSHRQTPIKQVVGSIREGLSEFFQIPDGYEVVLGNGGASAFWDIACASLITRKAAFGTYGSFSSKFAKSAQSAPFLEEPEIFAGEPGTYRLPELTEYVDTYCWAHNETSTGVAAPIKRIAGTKEQGALTLIDATSGAGALPVDISQTDATISRRKKLSDPMADYGLPYSPPLQSNAPTASPKAWIFRAHAAGFLRSFP